MSRLVFKHSAWIQPLFAGRKSLHWLLALDPLYYSFSVSGFACGEAAAALSGVRALGAIVRSWDTRKSVLAEPENSWLAGWLLWYNQARSFKKCSTATISMARWPAGALGGEQPALWQDDSMSHLLHFVGIWLAHSFNFHPFCSCIQIEFVHLALTWNGQKGRGRTSFSF